MIIITQNVVLANDSTGINGNNPVFGYHNLVATDNIISTSSSGGFPVTNLANPSTVSQWRGAVTTTTNLTVNTQNYTDEIDYVALARHNFGSAGIQVSLQVATTLVSGVPSGYTTIAGPVIVADDSPLIIRFEPRLCYGVRLALTPTQGIIPWASVLYVGKLLISERRIYVGHTPITDGRVNKFVNGISESMNFLGRIKLGQLNQTSIELTHLTPNWVRSYLRPFIRSTEELPFFFAWRPESYPNEVGFVWHVDDPKVSNMMSNGMMQASMNIAGITQ